MLEPRLPVPMSITLTATLPRAVIDLTSDAAPRPAAPQLFAAHKALPNAPLPPAKRRRVDDDPVPKAWRLKTCVQLDILPLVSNAVDRLPKARYRVDDIAVQVRIKEPGPLRILIANEPYQAITSISSNPTLRTRAEEHNGLLLRQHRVEAKGRLVDEIVERLAALPVCTRRHLPRNAANVITCSNTRSSF